MEAIDMIKCMPVRMLKNAWGERSRTAETRLPGESPLRRFRRLWMPSRTGAPFERKRLMRATHLPAQVLMREK
jgi:hypothetical protein